MRLTPQQEEAIEYPESAGIVAAPGSGKTTVLVEKVAHSLENHHATLARILVVTFTEKAASELQGRLARRLKLSEPQLCAALIGTIHSFFSALFREQGPPNGISDRFTILEEPLANLARRESVRRLLQSLLRERHPEAIEWVSRFDFSRSVDVALQILSRPNQAPSPFSELFLRIRRAYEEQKRRWNALDFQDLESRGLALLHQSESAGSISSRFDWIFIDEFQDTNSPQWEMARILHRPGKNRLVVVGDPRQSIYRFRGADPERFWEALRWIESSGGRLFYLDDNFRSDPQILDFVNRLSPQLFPNFSRPLRAQRASSPTGGVIKLPFAVNGDAEGRRSAEAGHVADRILELVQEGVPWNQIALLFRTRIAIPFYRSVFQRRGIPVAEGPGELLFDSPPVLAVLWCLRYYLNPTDPLPRLALETTPLRDPPLSSIRETFPEGLEVLLESLAARFAERQPLEELTRWILKLLPIGSPSLQALLESLESLRQEGAPLPLPEAQGPGVRFLTVHAAKGLEFPILFLCDLAATPARSRPFLLESGGQLHFRTPDPDAIGIRGRLVKSEDYERLEQAELEKDRAESRRLLYVALTRARDRLYLPLPVADRRPARDSWAWLLGEGER